MRFKVAPALFRDFPGLRLGVVVVQGADNSVLKPEIAELLSHQQKELCQALDKTTVAEHPHVTIWREAFKKFGAKPKEHLSSVENLSRRAVKGELIRSINPFVDIYNFISLKYLLPIGGEDLATIDGDLELTYAGPNEPAAVLLGDKEPRVPQEGEVLYKDATGAVCRRWNWKEADRTKLTPQTTNAIFVLEALPPVSTELVKAATNELALRIQEMCGGSVSVAFLDEQHPELIVKKDGALVTHEKPGAYSASVDVYHLKPEAESNVSSEHAIRLAKVEKLREEGVQPWPAMKPVTATAKQVIADFEADSTGKLYSLAGRLMAIRFHGKAAFADLQDRSGRLQLYIKQDRIGDKAFEFFKSMIDIGDIVWCSGVSFRTKMGEISLEVDEITLLSKSLYPMPEKFHGISDIEIKYRQRYLDLITSQDTRERFMKRTQIIKYMRQYLDEHDFIEVETPMLHPIPGGAAARPFVTHHNAYDAEFFLRIAPELYLKRLVVGGFERVYEINRNFRNEGVSTRHNPEFTMLEFYMAHGEYHYIMGFVEEMIRAMVQRVCGALVVPFDQYTLDFGQPFLRLNMRQALVVHAGLTEDELTEARIDDTMRRLKVKTAQTGPSYGQKIYALFEELAEKKLIQPTFIIDFPIEVSPLAKRDSQNPNIAARFELFIAGLEISNGFNELNDPFDQAERFRGQVAAHGAGDEEAHRYDAEFVHALEYGLPPTVGVGIGIDRLVMLLTNTPSIKEVILFPTLKRKD